MKGDVCFSREPTRAVFKAFGSLLCRRLELEWSSQFDRDGKIENTLLPMLPSNSGTGVDPERTWRRWRDYSGSGSAFASGQLEIAMEVIDQSVHHRLLTKGLADSCKDFFDLLSAFGRGDFSHDSETLDRRLDVAYETIFDLAQIESIIFEGKFLDLLSESVFDPASLPPRSRIAYDDYRGFAIDAAFASLKAMKRMELIIREVNNILDGNRINDNIEPAIVRELLLVKFNEDAADLVTYPHKSLTLTYKKHGGNLGLITSSAVKTLVARMNAQAKKL